MLSTQEGELWLGLFLGVWLLPVRNFTFCLIIHFKMKDANVPAPAALLSPPACTDILYYPLLAPWLVIQYHNTHTSYHQATPVWFLSKPLLLKVCQQRVERQKQNTFWLSNGEFLLEGTVVSWKEVLSVIQATMAFYWVLNSSAKLWCSEIPQTLLSKSTSNICFTIWSSRGIMAPKSLKGVGFSQLYKCWRMSAWRWSQRLA